MVIDLDSWAASDDQDLSHHETGTPESQAARSQMTGDSEQDAKARFLTSLEHQIRSEAAAERRNLLKIWRAPIPERVARGYAIEGLRIKEIRSNGYVLLSCTTNRSRFRQEDILCLNQGNPEAHPSLMVTLEEDNETELLVSQAGWGTPWESILTEEDGWMLDQGFLDLSSFYLDAVTDLGETTSGRERIIPLLMGSVQPQIDAARLERGLAIGDAAGLNWSQAEALGHAYATDSIYLIQGPPGTGKTRVLAHLAEALVDEGERVLVTAFTHRAVNNALNMLEKVAPLTPAAKIGDEKRASDLVAEFYPSFDSSPMAKMSSGYVIGATPFAPRTQRLAGVEFDTVVFDESSQITLPLAVMGMLPARRFIFIGDHKQLPPVLQSVQIPDAAERSVFGWLVDRGFDTMLELTYRLNADLAAWPSQEFYGGRLTPVEEAATRRISYRTAPERWREVLDPDRPRVFIDLGHKNAKTRSQAEANVVVDLIAEVLRSGLPASEVGVVTPYRAQAREIHTLMKRDPRVRDQAGSIVADTVERMQGQERDLIIVSLTTSDAGFAVRLADFFYQPQRINVAVTRPRSKLIIIGSSRLFDLPFDDPDLEAAIALLRELLGACDSVSLPEAGEGPWRR